MRWMLSLIALINISCALKPPKIDVCIHVQEQAKFRCKSMKTDNKYDRSYEEAPRYIAISPDDYNDVLDFIDEILERSGIAVSE